ncbi:MBOAT family O-acyltransferase [Sunxiuqinia sp. A32]|uniref:MBOAT family O-acyltransferase n=1 Tax=Sunxiuqinia sp. A32 TaxID=3461496 RepID=UPI004045445E
MNKLIGEKVKSRLIWLTLASFFFYGWWDWRFLFLIIFSGLVDYFAALMMQKHPKRKKLFFILSVVANIGSLSLFKYSGFIARNIDLLFGLEGNLMLSTHVSDFFLITPVGISFYTFQSMSYTFDVYREKLKPTKSVIHFFAYLSMFPQLVAGPIVRAKEMLPQMLKVTPISKTERWAGFQLIVRGYFKKMVIADNLAPLVVAAFSSPELNSSGMYWWGVMIAFAFQIYCDFAGYSDIARGLAKWMGYDFPDNFKHPYISISLQEFWTRWHISLSTWFRDYFYIPLGGNRKGKIRTHINLWITMLVSGLWHGAAWTFVAWSAVHSFFLSFEKITHWPQRISKVALLRPLVWFLVSAQVLLAWVFFRATSIDQAWEIVQRMVLFTGDNYLGWGLNGSIFITLMFLRELSVGLKLEERIQQVPAWLEMTFYAFVIVVIIFFRGDGSEFIYFQF